MSLAEFVVAYVTICTLLIVVLLVLSGMGIKK